MLRRYRWWCLALLGFMSYAASAAWAKCGDMDIWALSIISLSVGDGSDTGATAFESERWLSQGSILELGEDAELFVVPRDDNGGLNHLYLLPMEP